MKTVLQICEAFGGGQFYFIADLSNLLSDDFKFVVLHGTTRKATPKNLRHFFPRGTEFIAWNVQRELRAMSDLGALREARNVIARVNPDLIHCHSSKGGALARIASLGTSIPIIYTPNGYAFERRDVSAVTRTIYRGFEFVLGRIPHITVACGEAEFHHALRFARRAYLISNTVPPVNPVFPQSSSDRPLRAVMSGRITAQKNFPLFCAIADAARNSNVQFTWIGGGDETLSRKLPQNVTVTGWLPRDEANHHTAQADVFVQTALWEGLPLAVLEAMAFGKPVLATDIAPNRELVLQGANGFICTDANEFAMRLEEFSSDRNMLNRLGQCSRQIVERRYNANDAAACWRSIYNHYQRYWENGLDMRPTNADGIN